jgi:hypothetical protein
MQQNEIYNIPLPRGPGPKNKTQKKGNESGINYPGELKTWNSSRGHKISTRDGSAIDSDLTYKFEKLDRSSQGVFVSKNQTKVTYPLQPRAPTPQDYQPHPLVPNLAASTFTFGALLWRYRELKFKF